LFLKHLVLIWRHHYWWWRLTKFRTRSL
jgi:hypothetical protein